MTVLALAAALCAVVLDMLLLFRPVVCGYALNVEARKSMMSAASMGLMFFCGEAHKRDLLTFQLLLILTIAGLAGVIALVCWSEVVHEIERYALYEAFSVPTEAAMPFKYKAGFSLAIVGTALAFVWSAMTLRSRWMVRARLTLQ